MRSIASFKIISLITVRFLKWSAGFFALIILQISVLRYLGVITTPNVIVQPDLVLILLFFYGIRHPQISSTMTGFFSGLFLDALSGGILGLHALTKTIAGFLTGYVPNAYKMQKIIQFCFYYFVISIIHDTLYDLIYTINTEIGLIKLIFIQSLPSTIYSVFIGGIVFYWIQR